jgi:hypothetical protein
MYDEGAKELIIVIFGTFVNFSLFSSNKEYILLRFMKIKATSTSQRKEFAAMFLSLLIILE